MMLMRDSVSAEEHEFRYKAPDAKSVDLMCESNGWKGVQMTKGDDGVWTAKNFAKSWHLRLQVSG
jgi:1,4-alpha-glucan branching enzyme